MQDVGGGSASRPTRSRSRSRSLQPSGAEEWGSEPRRATSHAWDAGDAAWPHSAPRGMPSRGVELRSFADTEPGSEGAWRAAAPQPPPQYAQHSRSASPPRGASRAWQAQQADERYGHAPPPPPRHSPSAGAFAPPPPRYAPQHDAYAEQPAQHRGFAPPPHASLGWHSGVEAFGHHGHTGAGSGAMWEPHPQHLPAPHSAPPPGAARNWGAAAAPAEQWRTVQAGLIASAAADAAAAAAAAAAEEDSSALWRLLEPAVVQPLRRVWYLIDSRLGSLSTQGALLIAFAAAISLAGGRALVALRWWAADQGYVDVPTPLTEGVWLAWSLLIDPGLGVWPDTPQSLLERVSISSISIVGILYLSLVVGLVVGAVQEKMAALKQGLAAVVESKHTVILGWAEQSLTIIKELALANESAGGGVIVVLAANDKQAMEAELAAYLSDAELRGTKVVFRSGSRLRSADLRFVAVDAARAVVIISDVRLDPDTADAEVLQVVLNLTTLDMASGCSVVAEIRDIDNEPLVRMIGDTNVHTVTSHDIVGRLMLLFLRCPGLARVYGTLLGFEGSELYVKDWEALAGVRWADVAVRFPDAVPIGIRAASGAVLLNPSAGAALAAGDKLIVLSEDDDSYACEPPADLGPRRAFRGRMPEPPRAEAVLFAGWRRDVAHMIALLDRLVLPGSELHMLCPVLVPEREKQFAANGLLTQQLRNLRVLHHVGNCASQRGLQLVPLERITSAVVLSEQTAGAEVVFSDSHVLSTLLLIRGLQAGHMSAAGGAGAAGGVASGGGGSVHGGTGPPVKRPTVVQPRPRSFSGSAAAGAPGSKAIGAWDADGAGGVDLGARVPMVAEILDPRTQRTVNESYKVYSVSEFIQSNELISKMLAMIAEEPAVKRIVDALLGGSGGTLLALVPAEELVGADQSASFWEVARECMLTHGSTLCGYVDTPPPAQAGRRALPRVVLNPPDKATRRNWFGNKLVMIRTDARLLADAGLVAAPDLAL